MRIRRHLNLEHIHIIKKPGGSMRDSYLDEVRFARAGGAGGGGAPSVQTECL
jgi:hypothetical protein